MMKWFVCAGVATLFLVTTNAEAKQDLSDEQMVGINGAGYKCPSATNYHCDAGAGCHPVKANSDWAGEYFVDTPVNTRTCALIAWPSNCAEQKNGMVCRNVTVWDVAACTSSSGGKILANLEGLTDGCNPADRMDNPNIGNF